MTVKVRARHAVDLVEAGYMLSGTDAEWMAGIIAAGEADLAHGLGCYGFAARISHAGIDMLPMYAERELTPQFGAIVAQLNRECPDVIKDMLVRSAIMCGGFSELLGPDHVATRHLQKLGAASGCTEAFSLFTQDGEGYAINLSAPANAVLETPPHVRGIWRRVGVHLAAGLRLRRRLGETPASALFEADGKIAHAEADAIPAADVLKRAVLAIEKARTKTMRADPSRALDLWRGLVAGEWSLVERWESDGRRYIAAYENKPNSRDPRALTQHERTVLHYASLGASNKDIAFVLGVSVNSVASAVTQLFRKLRCRKRSDLMVAAQIALADRVSVELGGDRIDVLSVPPQRNYEAMARLSTTEASIAEMIISGSTTADIAESRKTSPHTVANQVRRILAKVGVHTRAELVHRLTTV